MGIFEDDAVDATPTDGSAEPRDARLDPLRRGIGLLIADGRRVGVVATDVQVWWKEKGLLRKQRADPREVVAVQTLVDVPDADADEELSPIADLYVDDYLESDDPAVSALLGGRLVRAGHDLEIRWLDGADAVRAHAENDHLLDIYPDADG
jgi:hypothetical protein